MALVDQILGNEKGATPDAKNPNSTAMGDGQFLEGTWLDTLAKYRPDIAGSREQLLALRADPHLSREMTDAYAKQNADALSNAGLPVTPGSTYLAHFAGPKGAIGILNADPAAPVGAVLGDRVVRANPFLANMTAADLQAWADRKMTAKGAPLSMAAPASMLGPQATVSAVSDIPTPSRSSPLPMSLAPPNAAVSAAIAGSSSADAASSQNRQAALASLLQPPEMRPPPPLFMRPRPKLSLDTIHSQAPATSRGFSFRG